MLAEKQTALIISLLQGNQFNIFKFLKKKSGSKNIYDNNFFFPLKCFLCDINPIQQSVSDPNILSPSEEIKATYDSIPQNFQQPLCLLDWSRENRKVLVRDVNGSVQFGFG